MREAYPFGFLGVPLKDEVRIQSTSSATGKRVAAFCTQRDIDVWDECWARSIVAAGGTNEDVVQVCCGYGLFTGGPGPNGGSHEAGSPTFPMSSGSTERKDQFLCDLGSTFCAVRPYAAYIDETVKEKGVRDPLQLKSGIFGAEAWSGGMREEIQKLLGLQAFVIYGLTGIAGPCVSLECDAHAGMHINGDHFYPEIISPATGEVPGRRSWRARLHMPCQESLPAPPVSHARPYLPYAREVRVRTYAGASRLCREGRTTC